LTNEKEQYEIFICNLLIFKRIEV